MSVLSRRSLYTLVVPLTGHVDRNFFRAVASNDGESCPSRGTWIEIPAEVGEIVDSRVVPLTGHVDRNINSPVAMSGVVLSCPSRGTWIEIAARPRRRRSQSVVPLTGHVDRNVEFVEKEEENGGRAPHGARG